MLYLCRNGSNNGIIEMVLFTKWMYRLWNSFSFRILMEIFNKYEQTCCKLCVLYGYDIKDYGTIVYQTFNLISITQNKNKK